MATTIQDVMATELVTCPLTATITAAARLMRGHDIGDVLVTRDDEQLTGIVTDRDVVVRCLAAGAAGYATIDRACSRQATSVTPDSSIDDAIQIMRDYALRRLAVVNDGRAVGIVTLGNLALEREPNSPLGDISTAAPTN